MYTLFYNVIPCVFLSLVGRAWLPRQAFSLPCLSAAYKQGGEAKPCGVKDL